MDELRNPDSVQRAREGKAVIAYGTVGDDEIRLVLNKELNAVKTFINKNHILQRYDEIEKFDEQQKTREHFADLVEEYGLEVRG
jgi:DNA replicative helicase MCM subunit Mcm2 (Cdc46/Mcm family)